MIHLPSPITVTAAQDTAIKTNLTGITTQVTAIAVVDLDTEAKKSLSTIDNVRHPYVDRTINIHAANFPQVQPGFLSYADAKTNFATYEAVRGYKASLYKLIESLDEISQVAENNAFEYMRQFYQNAKKAQDAGTVPGIQSVIDDLKTLIEQESQEAAPPLNP